MAFLRALLPTAEKTWEWVIVWFKSTSWGSLLGPDPVASSVRVIGEAVFFFFFFSFSASTWATFLEIPCRWAQSVPAGATPGDAELTFLERERGLIREGGGLEGNGGAGRDWDTGEVPKGVDVIITLTSKCGLCKPVGVCKAAPVAWASWVRTKFREFSWVPASTKQPASAKRCRSWRCSGVSATSSPLAPWI